MNAADAAPKGLFRAEPTSVFGVAALLSAVAHNDDSASPIEMYVNADAGKTVNDFLRQIAAVLREARSQVSDRKCVSTVQAKAPVMTTGALAVSLEAKPQ